MWGSLSVAEEDITTRAEQKRTTRQHILDAALHLSSDRGLSSVSLRAVAAEAGIAPATFYRHFADMDALALALVDEVGVSLRGLVRDARMAVFNSDSRDIIGNSIRTFMQVADENADLFRLLRGEGAGSTPAFRAAIQKEVERFADDVADDLRRASVTTGREMVHVELAAEAMVTIAFNLGGAALDLPPGERDAITERIIIEAHMVMRGSQSLAVTPRTI